MSIGVSVRHRLRRRGLGSVLVVLASVTALSGSTSSSVFADDAAEDDGGGVRAARLCESSNDRGDGEPGAKACFKDNGDDWFACDVDRGGSGTAFVFAAEFEENFSHLGWLVQDEYRIWHRAEEDNASDGVKVLGDCDKGPEVNINEGNWIRLTACIEKDGVVLRDSCDHRWIAE
jgi:hypothetical protein